MNDDEAFKLNSLHRFSKHSRLVLETHSHCEVPAGCGGVVLQWLDPAEGVPVAFEVATPSRVQTWVDGARVLSRLPLAPGPHVLALELETWRDPPPREPWLVVTAARFFSPDEREPLPACASGGDGTWRVATKAPPEAWTQPDFDDTSWTPLQRGALPRQLEAWQRERVEVALAAGAQALGLPLAPKLWVRKRFELPGVRR